MHTCLYSLHVRAMVRRLQDLSTHAHLLVQPACPSCGQEAEGLDAAGKPGFRTISLYA